MNSTQTRDAVHRELQAGALTGRLLDLYELAAQKEIADKEGRRWVTLTDYEAAAHLGCERSSVCSCRNRLVKDGIVREHYVRLCRHKPSQNRVSAWGLTLANNLPEKEQQGLVFVCRSPRLKRKDFETPQTNLFQ